MLVIWTFQRLNLLMEVLLVGKSAKRSTIYFEPGLHRALRIKAAHAQRTLSDLVNDAVRMSLQEDLEDLAAFDERADEPTMSYEDLLKNLKTHGKI